MASQLDPNRWTLKTKEALTRATDAATAASHPEVTPDHLAAALLTIEDGLALPVLTRLGLSIPAVRGQIAEALARLPHSYGSSSPSIGSALRDVLVQADSERQRLGDDYLSVEHLIPALAQQFGFDSEAARAAIRELRGSQRVTTDDPESTRQALKRYGSDLTELARQGRIDPVIGRDEEIRRVIQVLSRRTKNNPVLIGEPGVGKTAIVEGLARRIVEADVPEGLRSKSIVALDLGAMVAGAKYRGEFEDRLKAVLAEIRESNGEIISFIDELHTVVGAGRTDGAMDAGNMIKPLLARGELHLIGATTLDEYRKYIEKDAALERRFQPVLVEPPKVEDTITILRGLKETYEVHHGVRIQDAALVAAAVLSDRYITGRFLPDKAIDLVDEAASRLRIEIDSLPSELDTLERRRRQLEMEQIGLAKESDDASRARLERIEAELAELTEQITAMSARWQIEKDAIAEIRHLKEQLEQLGRDAEAEERRLDLGRAAEIRYGRMPELKARIDAATAHLAEVQAGHPMLKEEVDAEDVAEVISRWTGIPVSRLMEAEMAKLVNLEQILSARVVGQDDAVHAVASAIRRSRAGLSDPNRPIGSFLFLGPTGVGKTELAKCLADVLFDDEKSLVRIDMSEFQERHSVARLVGAPPGYVGYDEGGELTEAVRRRPYSVVLLDELEKAHPDVFNILLQIMDDGRLTDGQGRTVNFTNTILVMTSNLAVEPAQFFKPELVNRFDEIVRFRALDEKDMVRIVDLQLEHLRKRLAERRITLDVDQSATEWLATNGFDPAYGARPLRRLVQKAVGDAVATAILTGELRDGQAVTITARSDGGLGLEVTPASQS